jgi:hypothetical protein
VRRLLSWVLWEGMSCAHHTAVHMCLVTVAVLCPSTPGLSSPCRVCSVSQQGAHDWVTRCRGRKQILTKAFLHNASLCIHRVLGLTSTIAVSAPQVPLLSPALSLAAPSALPAMRHWASPASAQPPGWRVQAWCTPWVRCPSRAPAAAMASPTALAAASHSCWPAIQAWARWVAPGLRV